MITRILTLAGDLDTGDAQVKVRLFRQLLLLHAVVQSWHWVWVRAGADTGGTFFLALTTSGLALTGALALSFNERRAEWAARVALPVMVLQATLFFPTTTNHFYFTVWSMLVLSLLDARDGEESKLALQALQWMLACLLFWTGLQKVLHGTYFTGDFIAFTMGVEDTFADIFKYFVPADELTRLRAIDPNVDGAGPYRVDSPLLWAATNGVWLFEMAAPVALLHRRTRSLATLASMAFVFALQTGAREMMFCLLMLSNLFLFPPRAWIERAFWPLVALYLIAFAVSAGWLPGGEFLRGSGVPGRPHI